MRKYYIPLGSAVLFFLLLYVGVEKAAIPLSADPYAVYQKQGEKKFRPEFSFEDKSELIFAKKNKSTENYTLHVAVGDFDNDGYEDVMMVDRNSDGTVLKLLKNKSGAGFVDVSAQIANMHEESFNFSATALVDLDNDGWQDLYVAQFMKPHFVLKNEHGKFDFKNQIAIPSIIAPTRGISLFDFNNDGFVDIYLNSFSSNVYSSLFDISGYTKAPFPIRDKSGSENILLVNRAGKKLEQTENALGLSDGGYTWAVGVADFNNDGYPDVYVANDFGYDHFYKNNNGKSFTDISREALGTIRSENAMGADVADIENNGKLGIYISNASKPGMPRGWNHFWQPEKMNELNFQDVSPKLEIDKCGFSWGAKFSDFDKDGNLDLFVVNGRTGKQNSNNNRWFYRLYEWNLPPQLKYSQYIQVPVTNYNYASGQRNCVFWQKDGKFIDVAEDVGVKDSENGRTLVVFDFDNDGQEDILIGNLLHDAILYKGKRANENHWLGLKLIGKISNRDAIGARVKLFSKKSMQSRIVYPSNGFRGISSKKIIFGIVKEDQVRKLEVTWPDGKVQSFSPAQLDRYYEFAEAI